MNRYIVLLFIAIFSLQTVQIVSAEATDTPTTAPSVTSKPASVSATLKPSQTPEDKQVNDLKENIASKVAQLRKKDHKAVAGVITNTSSSQFTIKSSDSSYTIKLDDTLTKYYQIVGTSKKEIKQSDIKKDNYVIVSGLMIDNAVTANVIYLDDQYFVKSGKITEVNKDDGMLKVLTSEKDTLTLDVPVKLKMQLMDSKTLATSPTTFSKVKEGDTVHFIYSSAGKEKEANTYEAIKVLIIPQEFFLQK